MILGRVTSTLRARVQIEISVGGSAWDVLDAVIDTGFNGQLALPAETVRDLGLTLDRFRRVTPAIGVSRVVASGNVHLNWDGEPKNVRAIEAGAEPLIGMALLWGNRIMIDAIEDGAVSIAAIPATT